MSDQVWLSQLQKHRAIAVIRASDMRLAQNMAMAAAAGGMRLIEITWNSDRPGELISQLRAELPNCIIGTGTLFNVGQLQEAIASGAQFLFSPHVDSAMIQAA
ncbi:MAG: keto-deoxy-phosphogluconate aldolase, partial [Nodularia sp. (in: cyanobacteria)]|nr:keto-deoxy-phosphogluconate aldolase [Nodularia sp. (in: cyanobacteria)]